MLSVLASATLHSRVARMFTVLAWKKKQKKTKLYKHTPPAEVTFWAEELKARQRLNEGRISNNHPDPKVWVTKQILKELQKKKKKQEPRKILSFLLLHQDFSLLTRICYIHIPVISYQHYPTRQHSKLTLTFYVQHKTLIGCGIFIYLYFFLLFFLDSQCQLGEEDPAHKATSS